MPRAKQAPHPALPDAAQVGRAIRELRRRRHLQQMDLAAMIGMQAAPLCNIENGKHHPSLRTLCRIAESLGVTVNELVYPADYLSTSPPPTAREAATAYRNGDAPGSPLERQGIARVTRAADETERLTPATMATIQARINDYLTLEDLCGACKRAAIPLEVPFTTDEDGAEHLAHAVRTHCGIGSAIVFDYLELLENHGLRILFVALPEKVESLSFYDAANANAFLILGEGYNPEKQLFRLAFELANIYLFTGNRRVPVKETNETRRFAKQFAAFFLMPREAVRATVTQLGVKPTAWSYDLLLRIKHRFGVSAEAFAHRLEEIGALDKGLRQEFKARIQAHYAETGFSEPALSSRELSRNGRFGDLLLCARRVATDATDLDAIAARAR